MIGEYFEIYLFQMAKKSSYPPWLEILLEITSLKQVKIILDYYPEWLEYILQYTCNKWLNIIVNCLARTY